MNKTLVFNLAVAFAPENVVKELQAMRDCLHEEADARDLQRGARGVRQQHEARLVNLLAKRERTAKELTDRAFVETPDHAPVNGRAYAGLADA